MRGFFMPTEYVMTRDKWLSTVAHLLPNSFEKSEHGSKQDIAFDLSIEFGIISGLLPSGWYPEEAVDIFLSRELDKESISYSDYDEFQEKLLTYRKNQIK